MTVHTFCKLLYPDVVDLLHREGVFIGKRKTDGLHAILFQVDDFYVEIIYVSYRSKISSVNVTKNMTILDAYLPQVDIKEIIGN